MTKTSDTKPTAKTTNTYINVVNLVEKFLTRYAFFSSPGYAFVCALWVVATHFVEQFESVPYMVITALTRQSGKTLLMELMKWASANPFDATGVTASALYRTIDEKMPTVFVDESEALNKDSNPLRPFLNVGYRKGQTIPRTQGKEVVEFKTFGFKLFTLIGGVYATLHDRSIITFMRRATLEEKIKLQPYRQGIAKSEGESIRDTIAQEKEAGAKYDVQSTYDTMPWIDFLGARDAEIWRALFVICQVFCPDRTTELRRISVDMAGEKLQEMSTESKEAEEKAQQEEYKIRLLADMITVVNGCDKLIPSAEVLPRLFALDIAPWRKYKGVGITIDEVGLLMGLCGIKSKVVRIGKGKASRCVRGYTKSDLHAAAIKLNPLAITQGCAEPKL